MAPPRVPRFLGFNWSDLRPGPAQRALERFFDTSLDDAERIRALRKVLSLESTVAHCMVFDLYQQACMNSRWGPSNALEEVLGVMRVKALAVLRHPDGPEGKKHVAAAQVIARAPRPKDIPLILSRLDESTNSELTMFLYWALQKVVEELEAADMMLIEAMERRLVPGLEATDERVEASRVLADHRAKAAEEALLRALPKLAPNEAIPVAIALLAHDPVRYLDLARRIRDALPAGYPTEEDASRGMHHWHGVLLDDIESAEKEGAEVMASRARIAAIRETIDADPAAALAPLLEGLKREEHKDLTPALCRRLARADDSSAREVLRALGQRPAATRTLFHAIEPWLTHEDHELRGLAMRVALASRSEQARARLMTRLRSACTDDAADACTILRALEAESQLYGEVVEVASSSPIPEVRDTVAALLAAEEARQAAEDAAEASAEAGRASSG